MIIKKPSNLKVAIFSTKSFYVIKFLNKYGCIKKKFDSQFVDISIKDNDIILKPVTIVFKKKFNAIKLQKLTNKIRTYKLLIEQLILNMFKPIKDRLILEGVGFKVWKKKQCLKLKLGYSAPVFLKIPSGIKISLYKQRKISISGLCTQYVRIFKHKLCSLKIPDAYKKKGIRIWGEVLKFKVGKKTR